MADDYIIKGDPDTAPSVPTGNIDLESDVSGVLPILNGGTGVNSIAAIKSLLNPIGTIIESATCDTMAKVIEAYGGTTWLQHTGYVLRGATNGVSDNNAVKDGGEDTITPSGTVAGHKLTAAESGVPAHSHGLNEHTHSIPKLSGTAQTGGKWAFGTNLLMERTSSTNMYHSKSGVVSSQSSGSQFRISNNSYTAEQATDDTLTHNGHTHSVETVANTTGKASGSTANNTATAAANAHDHGFTGTSHTNLPSYKNVYIWERIA